MGSFKHFKYLPFFIEHGLENCPPENCQGMELTAFRYVFEEQNHFNNFAPVFIINPSRINGAADKDSICQGFGLSLFQREQGALDKYSRWMKKTKGAFAKSVGEFLAAVQLETQDGIGSEPDEANYSHFTFHEYAEADLSKKIAGLKKIEA